MTDQNGKGMPGGGQVIAIIPQNLEETYRVANGVVKAGLAPYSLTKDRTPEQAAIACVVAIMSGAELGLPPMASLRSFTVINGRPALYGDGLMAVVRKSGKMKRYVQSYDPAKAIAFVEAERSDTGEVMTYTFSKQEAIDAGLWDDRPKIRSRSGAEIDNPEPWHRYKSRMMIFRARTYLLRDLFTDVLTGVTDEYEARDSIPFADFEEVKSNGSMPPSPPEEEVSQDTGDDAEGEAAEGEPTEKTPQDILDNLEYWLDSQTDEAGIEAVWKELDIETEFAADPDAHAMALAMRDQHTDRVTKKPAPTDEAKGPEPEPQQGDIPFPGDKK